ncbi:MAG: eRF1 domain 2 [Bdellovibrionia bacterium]
MSLFVIWVDGSQAKLFQFVDEKAELLTLHSHRTDHHTHPSDQMDKAQQERKFYNEIAHKLNPASQILILGPGVAKQHFQTYLTEHYPVFARRIVGCEAVDHPTDNQIISLAKTYFKTQALPAHSP